MTLSPDKIKMWLRESVRLSEGIANTPNNGYANTLKGHITLLTDDLPPGREKRDVAAVLAAKARQYTLECDIADEAENCQSDDETSKHEEAKDLFGRTKDNQLDFVMPEKSKATPLRSPIKAATPQKAMPLRQPNFTPTVKNAMPKTPKASPDKSTHVSPASVVSQLSKRWNNDFNINDSPTKRQKKH